MSPSYLLSEEFFALLTGRFANWSKKVLFILFTVICCVLAVTAGPAAATIMLQLNDWQRMGGTCVFLNITRDTLYQHNYTSSHTLSGDVCLVTGSSRCPSAGWENLQRYAEYFPVHAGPQSKGVNLRPPVVIYIPTIESMVRLSSTVREPVGVDTSDFSVGESRMVMPFRVVGEALVQVVKDWGQGSVETAYKDGINRRGASHQLTARIQTPTAKTRCSMTFINGETQSSSATQAIFPDLRTYNGYYQLLNTTVDIPAVQVILQTINRTAPDIRFFDIDSQSSIASNSHSAPWSPFQ